MDTGWRSKTSMDDVQKIVQESVSVIPNRNEVDGLGGLKMTMMIVV